MIQEPRDRGGHPDAVDDDVGGDDDDEVFLEVAMRGVVGVGRSGTGVHQLYYADLSFNNLGVDHPE